MKKRAAIRQLQPLRIPTWVQLVGYALLWAVVLPVEWDRIGGDWTNWFSDFNADTSLFLPLLLLAPVAWFVRRELLSSRGRWERMLARWFGPDTQPTGPDDRGAGARAWLLAMTVAGVSLLMSVLVARMQVSDRPVQRFGELPPAYHDEYAYRFQAETFLQGQATAAGHPDLPELFDQVHVLNEGRMASRYFPATGLWLAPFLQQGHPDLGWWVAGALSAFWLFWSGRELGGNAVGFLAGLLLALSPGLMIFRNLLLAHHPTLMGLMLFLCCFLRLLRTVKKRYAFLAGLGLAWAMLARPMTAAGFALPMGMVMAVWWVRGAGMTPLTFRERSFRILTMAIPLVAGFGVLFWYNHAVTGNVLTSPYQLYTDIYTPRHVYGFNNVQRGEQHLGPKVLDNYDRWAENLTPALAVQNVFDRLIASGQLTFGLLPLGLVLVIFLLTPLRWSFGWWLVFASIVSLHLAHVPYWFAGIMNWHYVLETAPLWVLLFAGVTQRLRLTWNEINRPLMKVWWQLLIGVALVNNFVGAPVFTASRLEVLVSQVAFSRLKYADFQRRIAREVRNRPALVLIEPDPTDRHIDYVTNSPGLQDEVLFGRYNPREHSWREIAPLFPDRSLYLFNAQTRTLEPLLLR